jgi:outer membrane murein-binding lipoprotein Lpp
MNPTALLALISDLYAQVAQLTEDNKALTEALQQQVTPEPESP